jgi:hypothetical protein
VRAAGGGGAAPQERPRGLRTRSAWLLAVPFLLLARPSPELLGGGALLASLGLLLRGWAAGTIRKDEVLTTSGPYAHLRHPLYAGSFLIGVGLAVMGGHWAWAVLVVVFFMVIYRRTLGEEGRRLGHLFDERYRHYSEHVPALLPRLTPYRPTDEGESTGSPPLPRSGDGFAWRRYLRNREWEALLGTAAALGVLAAKMRWLG